MDDGLYTSKKLSLRLITFSDTLVSRQVIRVTKVITPELGKTKGEEGTSYRPEPINLRYVRSVTLWTNEFTFKRVFVQDFRTNPNVPTTHSCGKERERPL